MRKRVLRGALWEVFNNHGKVTRIFIPLVNKKPRYRQATLAFNRFVSEKDMVIAIKKMNNSKIDGRVISVSKARFPISGSIEPKHTSGRWAVGQRVEKRSEPLKHTLAGSEVIETFGLDSRTFRDVSRLPIEQSNNRMMFAEAGDPLRKSFDIHIPSKDTAWINLSLVGVMKQLYDLDSFKRRFLVTPLMNDKGVPAAFLKVFLFGVLHCWHESFFEVLGNRWGSFIDFDSATWNRDDLSVAELIIRDESPYDIPNSIKVRSFGRSYVLKITLDDLNTVRLDSEMLGEDANFADVWPGAELLNDFRGIPPTVGVVPGGSLNPENTSLLPRNTSIGVELGPDYNLQVSDDHVDSLEVIHTHNICAVPPCFVATETGANRLNQWILFGVGLLV
ncbi:hypothetical protein V6N11_064427 [Hibiscus sabdariffa]|uniref:RRM domain-containing protein n=1 Tax=Hibiscus sabdariffa TaxID=183260 RepID=A0ABR2P8Y3_9ROSI